MVPSDRAQWMGAHSLSIRSTNRAAASRAAKFHRSPPSKARRRATSSGAIAWKLPRPAIRAPSEAERHSSAALGGWGAAVLGVPDAPNVRRSGLFVLYYLSRG